VSTGLEQSGVVSVASAARAEAGGTEPSATDSAAGAMSAARRAVQLGAGTLVWGSYYWLGTQWHFHVQITDVARGEVLDAFDALVDSVSDSSSALEPVRQRVLGSLASFLDPRLRSWVQVASKPPTFDAYREFVSGQSLWGSDPRQALGHFLRAAQLDSSFYAARVEAATLYRLLGECARTESIARELGTVRDRLAPFEYHMLDEQVAECNGDWERAYRQARAVAEVRRGSAFLEYSVALHAMQLGQFGEARQLLDRYALEQGVAEVGPNYAIVYAQVVSQLGDRSRGLDATRWLTSRYPGYARGSAMELTLLARSGRSDETERLVDALSTQRLTQASILVTGIRRAAAALSLTGDSATARRILTRALAILDADIRTEQGRTRLDRAQVLYELGRFEEARALLTALAVADSGDVDVRGYVGLVAARQGDTATASAIDRWLSTAAVPYVFTRSLYRARIAAVRGQRESALSLLGAGLDEGGRFLLPGIREFGEFASIRGEKRFEELTSVR